MDNEFNQFYSGKLILITGANGYIGSNIIKYLENIPCNIIMHTREITPVPVKCVAEFLNITGDIKNIETWDILLDHDIDVVFHLAGQTNVYEAENNPIDDLQANCEATLHLLEKLRAKGKNTRIIFASTATVVGLTTAIPTNEDHLERPITVYDVHKLTSEHYIRFYAENGWISGASLRLCNVYGKGIIGSATGRSILDQIMCKAIIGEQIYVYEPGTWLRDYIYIDDVVSAFLFAGLMSEQLGGNAFIIGSEESLCLNDVFNLVLQNINMKTGNSYKLKNIPAPNHLSPIEFRNYVSSATAFKQTTGWSAQTSLADGIDKTVDFYLSKMDQNSINAI